MTRPRRAGNDQRCRALMLGAGLLLGSAGAQDLDAYRTLGRALDRAGRQVETDPEAAREQFGQAGAALNALLPTLPGGAQGQVARTLQDTVNRAQSALDRTPAEVQANVLLARGLMRRALYDQATADLRPVPDPANDTAALRLLARELGFGRSSNTLSAEARAGKADLVIWRLRRVAASKVKAALDAVEPGGSAANNYLSLTQASSWFSLVREVGAETTPPMTLAQFERALQDVTTSNRTALENELAQLEAGAQDLNRRFAVRPAARSGQASVGTPEAATPADPTTPVNEAPVDEAPRAEAPVTETPTPTPAATPSAGAQALDASYAALAHALNASGRGDPVRTREALAQATGLLGGTAPALQQTPAFAQLQRDLQVLQYRMSVRPDAVQALITELGMAEDQAAGRAQVGSDGFAVAAGRTVSGWVRVLLALALAALAMVPLYLLNLAFGGSNIYWRSISAGLLVLVSPILLEGLFGLVAWLGDLLGISMLRGAVNLTLNQGAGGLLVRGLLSALGLTLLTYGFHGLCQQFGLLGRRLPTNAPKRHVSPRYTQTGLDWEEEL